MVTLIRAVPSYPKKLAKPYVSDHAQRTWFSTIRIKKGHGNLLTIPLNNFGHKMVTTFRIALPATYRKCLYNNMGDTGLEPVTPCLSSEGNALYTNLITA